MTVLALLFLTGLLLMAGEVFVPGGVMGAIGVVAMAAGCAMAFVRFGVGGGVVSVGLALGCLGATLYMELVWLPKSRFGRAMVVQSVSGGAPDGVTDVAALVGKVGEAATTLAPSGYVLVDGKRHEAFCVSGYVSKGASLRVTGRDNFRLIVTKNSEPSS